MNLSYKLVRFAHPTMAGKYQNPALCGTGMMGLKEIGPSITNRFY